jgi:hypothetical protein
MPDVITETRTVEARLSVCIYLPVTFVLADLLNITISSWTIEGILNLMDQSSYCFYLSLRLEPVMLEFGIDTSENGFFLNMNGDWAALSV